MNSMFEASDQLAGVWDSFDEIICLTLEGDIDRQRQASQELCKAGMQRFVFFEGVNANARRVADAFANGEVSRFPPCFRCKAVECHCDNNTLIRPQVACFMSFMEIFKQASRLGSHTFLVVEDDVVLEDYAVRLANEALTREQLSALGFFDQNVPCLLSLGQGKSQNTVRTFDTVFSWTPGECFPANPCFAFNKPFAELAVKEFTGYTHTVDVYIHFELSRKSTHFGLSPRLAHDRSTSLGTTPSRIHPKALFLERAENSDREKTTEAARIREHLKKTLVVNVGIFGIPRGGTGWAARASQGLGIDIGHEGVRSQGISSWMLASQAEGAPFGTDVYARNPTFLHFKNRVLVARNLFDSVPSQVIENTKNIQSFAFRRKLIQQKYDYNCADTANQVSRAVLVYFLWYQLCLDAGIQSIVKVGDVAGLAQALGLPAMESDAEQALLSMTKDVNRNKPYLGQVYARPAITTNDVLQSIAMMTAREKRLVGNAVARFPADMKALCLGSSEALVDRLLEHVG
jgi:hypothetical protein